jgi:hypothetical protein
MNAFRKPALLLALAVGAALSFPAQAQAQDAPLPHVVRSDGQLQLIVDGQPFIALAGEVHNSTASSPEYMAPIWPRLQGFNLNTVVSPIYWELVEPAEGRYDFALVDEQLRQARAHGLRLVLLWFGTTKNAKSTYAPAWVLGDRNRFSRARTATGDNPFDQGEPVLSVFDEDTMAADARGFAALMAHLAEADPQHTVIAVQVENEAGLLGDSRDRSDLAERAWRGPVPANIIARLRRGNLQPSLQALWAANGSRTSGTWSQVFGNDWQADEAFMAWGVSRYIDHVAAAGKQELPLPMYANAWLGPQNPGDAAGANPSGGPVPRVFDIWQANAPHLDWLSPDIYVDDYAGWAGQYAADQGAVFVPEARFEVGNLFTTLGALDGFGFAPFGIEDGLPGNQLADAYGVLSGALPVIARAQADNRIAGFVLQADEVREIAFPGYRLTVRGQREAVNRRFRDMGVPVQAPAPEPRAQTAGWGRAEMSDVRPSGLVIMLADGEFLLAGKDIDLTIADDTGRRLEVVRYQEGRYVAGEWQNGRVLNGDERMTPLPTQRFGMVRIRVLPAAGGR